MRILVVAAHPDDEVLGCGGTVSRLASEGHEVTIAVLGEGATSRADSRAAGDRALVDTLDETVKAVAKKLSAMRAITLGLPDNRFDSLPLLDVIKPIEKIIADVRPHTIYTHHGGDLNVDHRTVNHAVLTATRPTSAAAPREVLTFEIPSSTEWSFQKLEPVFRPNVFVDIERTLRTKIDALALYESEVRPFPHPRSPEALAAIAQRWGSVVGVKAAEAFELVRTIR